MNCAECKERLVVYLEGLLDDSQKQTVGEHLNKCEACRAELEGLATLQQRLVNNGKALAQNNREDEVMNRIFCEQNARLKSAAQATAGLRLRRLIMKSTIGKLAIAAAVVLACAGGIYLWSGTQPTVALADVLVKIEQIQAFMYKMTMHMTGPMQNTLLRDAQYEMTALISNAYGMRMDINMVDPNTGQSMTQQMYVLPEQKTIVMLMPQMKKYMRMELDESMFERMQKQSNDPRIMIKQILACKYEELGKSVIDGVEVEGFQTTDPAYSGGMGDVDVKLWVDVKTWLPVRVDMSMKMNEETQMQGTLHDFQWDVPVTASEFTSIIPADYTAGPGDGLKMPPMTEKTAIEGLKLCVDLIGKYPENLNIATIVQMIQESRNSKTPEAQKLRQAVEQAKTDEERTQAIGTMMPLQMLGGFYMSLAQEKKEPAYYGNIVKPGDVAQVLLRWKTAENEYRVIFADLHAETVNAETLAQLEAGLPK